MVALPYATFQARQFCSLHFAGRMQPFGNVAGGMGMIGQGGGGHMVRNDMMGGSLGMGMGMGMGASGGMLAGAGLGGGMGVGAGMGMSMGMGGAGMGMGLGAGMAGMGLFPSSRADEARRSPSGSKRRHSTRSRCSAQSRLLVKGFRRCVSQAQDVLHVLCGT